MNKLEVIVKAIDNIQHALICGHIMPDGDCLGSMQALALALKKLGKKATIAGPEPIPEIYNFLPGLADFHSGSPPEGTFDTLITLDCPIIKRLGPGYQDLPATNRTVINIDHHASEEPYGTYRYIDPQAAAAGEIIFDLLQVMQVPISLDMAICLYTAIMTDTGSFQYENTTAETHKRVARLLEIGVPFSEINLFLFEEKPRAAQFLLGEALKTLSFSSCGQISWLVITRDMLRATGAKDEHAEGIVNYTRSIKGVEVGILFHELPQGRCKISFRSKKKVDVSRLAFIFGGGGHRRAAGCEVRGEAHTIIPKVVTAALQIVGDME